MRRTILRVEELGQRVLPSASPLTFHPTAFVAPFAQAHHATSQDQNLHGNGVAVYTSSMQIPDTGTSYNLRGVGSFGAVGVATITGELHSVGFIMQGHATGTLTLTNARGSVTLELTGPTQPGFAPLPQQFTYQVVSGTGAFANLHASGTLQLQTVVSTPGVTGFGVFSIHI
jgi:hypothetical protein